MKSGIRRSISFGAAILMLALVRPAVAQQQQQPPPAPTNADRHDVNSPTGAQPGEDHTVDLASTYIAVGADRSAAYTTAIAGLDGRLDRATRPNDIGIELNCWVHKLKTEAQVDDRVIEWTRICPRLPTGPAQPSSVCEDFAVNEEQLYGLARTADEVEAANNQLHFIAHVKAEVLELQTSFPGNDRDQFVVDALVRLLRDVKKAQRELDAMAASSERGGIPRHYRAIREWIARRAADPKSLYAPCS